jgi:hypothetical protein
MISHLAQTHASSMPTPASLTTSPLIEGGLLAAIVVYFIKEGVGFFKKKDADEAALTTALIQDLRSDRREELRRQGELLLELRTSYQQIAQAIEKMSVAIADVSLSHQQSARTNTEIFALLREHSKQFAILSEKISTMQNRHSSYEQSTNGKTTE